MVNLCVCVQRTPRLCVKLYARNHNGQALPTPIQPMQLTLHQAAAALGKTRRQVQYLIQQGRLPAQKVGGRWYVESADLEADPAAAQP
jgi:excisionase family DNA binding protein